MFLAMVPRTVTVPPPSPALVSRKCSCEAPGREKAGADKALLHPQVPSHHDKDLKGANEISSSAFYSSVTTTKLDEMTPCPTNLRPILLPPTPILSLLNGYKTLKTQKPMGLVTDRPVLQRVLLRPPRWGHDQFNLHASETAPLNKIRCFSTPARSSAQSGSSPFSLRALTSTQPERRRQKEDVSMVSGPPGSHTAPSNQHLGRADHPHKM